MSRHPTLEDVMGADAPLVVAVDWGFADPNTPVAREWARRAEVNDRVWRVLQKRRAEGDPDRRVLAKNQQYAYGYGASLRQLHEMARAWSVAGRLVEASRFVHASTA